MMSYPMIPTHWPFAPLKAFYEVTLGKMVVNKEPQTGEVILPYLRSANVQHGHIVLDDVRYMPFQPEEAAILNLRAGDLLICEGGDAGRSALLDRDLPGFSFQNSVIRIRPKGSGNNRFLAYWFEFLKKTGYLDILCNKATIAHCTAHTTRNILIPIPPPDEQVKISNLLDQKFRQIDEIISAQKSLIGFLNEKRRGLLTHIISQELYSPVSTQPFNIFGMDCIPAHWQTIKLKYLTQLCTQTSKTRTFSIGLENIESWTGRLISTQTEYDGDGIAFCKGDILLGKIRPYLAKAWVADREGEAVGAFLVLRPGPQVTSEFLKNLFLSIPFVTTMSAAAQGTTMPQIHWDIVKNTPIPLPPLYEQLRISESITRESTQIDRLISDAQTMIELLQERKNALIYTAFTGQIPL